MQLHWFQHVPFEGLGFIQTWAENRGHEVSCTRFWAGEEVPDTSVDALILMGGPMSVHDDDDFPWITREKEFLKEHVHSGCPVFGICLGAQLLAECMGAIVTKNPSPEIGWFPIEPITDHPITQCFPSEPTVLHWHGETFTLPDGATHLWRSAHCEQQAFTVENRLIGFQFHVEMTEAGVAAIIEACPEDLEHPSPTIQEPSVIYAAAKEQRKALETALSQVLDLWVGEK
ncbi:MAG: type 1 glutamine amidotransferase [Verrucomicrobiota bacterium]